MKFSLTTINVAFTVMLTVTSTMDTIKGVSADRMVRFIFNGGVAPTSSTYCSDADDAKINSIFGTAITTVINRHERDLSSNETIITKSDDRQLFPAYCKDNCKGCVAKTCRATNCVGYRRDRELGQPNIVSPSPALPIAVTSPSESPPTDVSSSDRDLQVSCTEHMASITNSLNALITNNQVSSTCKAYLNPTKRSTSCYDDVIYGEIEGVKVWDLSSSTPRVMSASMPASGFSFCASKKFSLTSMNHPCVDRMKFELYGPNGYAHVNHQYALPYSIFYEDDNGNLKGRILSRGSYMLKMTPDEQYSKQKIFYFTLNNC